MATNALKSRSLQLQNLEFSRLDCILQTNFTEQVALQHTQVKKEINNILKQQSEFQIHRTRQKYYFHGARPSHILAMRIRELGPLWSLVIPAIKLADGNISTDSKQINGIFQTLYSELYKSEVSLDKNQCENLHLPQLSSTGSTDLDKLILLEEVWEAAKAMQKGKSPGIDWIPPEFYVIFWEPLGPFLLDMIVFFN